ncbi:MAG TPA: hypothetical protein PK733_19650 [Clostridiales bacterium]|nr:hypothetical protein [Clostridiales bacterium]
MSRFEKHKNLKKYKKYCRRVFYLSLLLATVGVIAADHSINGLMGNNGKLRIVSFGSEDSRFEICIMNYRFHPNVEFFVKLADNIKNVLK